MGRPCPWCLEPLPFGRAAADPCPACGRELVDAAGRELRPVDLRSEQVEAWQCDRYRELMAAGTATVAVLALVVPLVPLAIVLAPPLFVLAHLMTLRLVLLRQTVPLLGTRRRMMLRWLLRLGVLWAGGPAYAAASAPFIGVLPAAGAFALLTTAAHHYSLWSLRRERDRQPAASWEIILLIGLAVLTLAVMAVAIVLAGLLGWSVAQLIEGVGG